MTLTDRVTLVRELPTTPTRGEVRLRGVTKVFGRGAAQTTALREVDLTVRPGEFLTVVGASGCGKSTMLSLVAGLDQPTQGTVEVGGTVAFMFQDATLLPWLTAAQNVALALRLRGSTRRAPGHRTSCWSGCISGATSDRTGCPAGCANGSPWRVLLGTR